MARKRKGVYFEGENHVPCEIIRSTANNTRIVLEDGTEKLVPSHTITSDIYVSNNPLSERVIPTIPLEHLYRSLRRMTGTSSEKFSVLRDRLNPRHGPKDAEFLGELYRRSLGHATSYANVGEAFYSKRAVQGPAVLPFASELVQKLDQRGSIRIENHVLEFVDYEIFPFRTTKSILEDGTPATHAGSGGMDLLLASTRDNATLPAVGEIKARTESVGPTFALIQSLMYAAQLATRNQFLRLKSHYHGHFDELNEDQPRLDIVLFIEAVQDLERQDLEYALTLAADLEVKLTQWLRNILFLASSPTSISNDLSFEKIPPG